MGDQLLYGKWRPSGFDEVVGQDHIVTTLRNALISGQVAHAYLFSGPRGTGKTTTARILARAVNCANLVDGNPCNACPACIAIGRGAALDLIEMDAASNRGIEDIRELREKIGFAPSDLKKKVYLLDEVHMLTSGAFNALLKTLEEPPPHAIFILATTELHQVPATILSRCQRHDFHRVSAEPMVARLQFICDKEGFAIPGEALLAISAQARGGVRDAITLLEQVVAQYGPSPATADVLSALGLVHDERSESLVRAILEEDLATALTIAREVADDGLDIARFTRESLGLLREMLPPLLRAQAPGEDSEVAELVRFALARGTTPRALVTAVQELARADFRLDPASPIPLELACAAAILQPQPVVAAAGVPTAAHTAVPGPNGQRPISRSVASAANNGSADGELSPNERFLRDLYERCKMINVRMAGYLNGSCEVISIEAEELELGFYYPFHQQKVELDGRVVIEQQAEVILGRPVRLKTRLVARDGAAATRKPSRGGHLAETAKSIGATPVAKE